ncbi:MAG: hypothetical protein WKG03_09240, partial [Telluria sp.]
MLKIACRSAQTVLLALVLAGQAQGQVAVSAPAPSPAVAPVPAGAPKGTLVIIGGGLRGEN